MIKGKPRGPQVPSGSGHLQRLENVGKYMKCTIDVFGRFVSLASFLVVPFPSACFLFLGEGLNGFNLSVSSISGNLENYQKGLPGGFGGDLENYQGAVLKLVQWGLLSLFMFPSSF